jgi:3-hydroxyisobutyrate dehydrogenase-like beta-hydroxyacid dehydrogenase
MYKIHIGFLHPGAMGISLAATAQNTDHTAYWVSQDRSPDTYERAARNSLVETQTIEELCDACSVIISVCPPHAAVAVAEQVLACSFEGVYADVNAISPQRAKRIGQSMTDAGVEFVDGGIIGGPAWTPQSTVLYLSGRAADQIEACFAGGPLTTEVIGDDIGKASALKMCYAANTKGTTALLCAIVAAAEEMGVRKELEEQWSRHDSDFAQQTLARISRVTAKAWRFSGEMEEIASTLEAVGLPGGFHLAACDIYHRIAKFKGADPIPPVGDVLDALLRPDEK